MKQPLLFPDPPHTLARRTDPPESREAAEHIAPLIGQREAEALSAVKRYPGRTGSELDELCGKTKREISKRLAAMERKRLVRKGSGRKCATSEQTAATWFAID